ncbi:MAG: GIY-YIG nuclease family protein [Candidatus Cloacimonetes bacterium]|nr:GIY-YIG nuclease family protein [Candidatus Cloacimonadota bacterium]
MTKKEMERLRERWCSYYNRTNNNHSYVYVYRHPHGEPNEGKAFYIGKGTRERVFSHLDLKLKTDLEEKEKVDIIRKLLDRDLCPDIDILIDELDSKCAFEYETIAIDAVGKENLTNKQRGHKSKRCPIQFSSYIREEAIIKHPLLKVNLNIDFQRFFPRNNYDMYDQNRRIPPKRVNGYNITHCLIMRWAHKLS